MTFPILLRRLEPARRNLSALDGGPTAADVHQTAWSPRSRRFGGEA
jgi:hypothetical protein